MIRMFLSFLQNWVRLRFNQTLAIALGVLVLPLLGSAQSWTSLTNSPGVSANTLLLLTDGTVMVQQGQTGHWFRLTPDRFGSYINGTWTQLADMPAGYAPLYFASAVLPDGRVVAEGGEFNNGSQTATDVNLGAIYNPATNTWTSINPPSGATQIGDAASVVLPNGTLMVGTCCSSIQYLLNASTLTWTAPNLGKADSNGEEGWTLLPNGQVLTVDTHNGTNSELYNPTTTTWSTTGSTVVSLIQANEVGSAVLRPDGTVFATGANSNTAIYNSATGGWSAGPVFPNGLGVPDGPAALLPSGNVLVDSSPTTGVAGTQFFEFNGTNLLSVPGPLNAAIHKAFEGRMLVLPTGQVLFTDGSSTVQIYTPTGTFQNAWRPTISSVASTLIIGSVNNAISGTQFNGLSQGAMYGDDAQAATNYPLVRITNNNTGDVFYAKTHNHSTMAVATGATTVSTQFDLPITMETGASTLVVVANGIPSSPVNVTIANPPSHATGTVDITGWVYGSSFGGCGAGDEGTIQITVNTTAKSLFYDSSCANGPADLQSIATQLAALFNSDPNSPVTATAVTGPQLPAGYGTDWKINFVTKGTGTGVNYAVSTSVNSVTFGTATAPQPPGSCDPCQTLTVTPPAPYNGPAGTQNLTGFLSGGH